MNFTETDAKSALKVKKEKCKNTWNGTYGLTALWFFSLFCFPKVGVKEQQQQPHTQTNKQ